MRVHHVVPPRDEEPSRPGGNNRSDRVQSSPGGNNVTSVGFACAVDQDGQSRKSVNATSPDSATSQPRGPGIDSLIRPHT